MHVLEVGPLTGVPTLAAVSYVCTVGDFNNILMKLSEK